jgi:hypothetical protein
MACIGGLREAAKCGHNPQQNLVKSINTAWLPSVTFFRNTERSTVNFVYCSLLVLEGTRFTDGGTVAGLYWAHLPSRLSKSNIFWNEKRRGFGLQFCNDPQMSQNQGFMTLWSENRMGKFPLEVDFSIREPRLTSKVPLFEQLTAF